MKNSPPTPGNPSPGSGQITPGRSELKLPRGRGQAPKPERDSRKELARQQDERQNGGRSDADDGVVGGADPAETDPERGERTP